MSMRRWVILVALAGCGGGRDNPDAATTDAAAADAAFRADAGAPAQLSMTPTAYNFGSVAVATSGTTVDFTISNAGGQPSGALTVALGGPDAGEFSIVSNACGAAIGAGASCVVRVRLSPTTGGAKSAALTASANPGGSVTAALIGDTGAGDQARLVSSVSGRHDFGTVVLNKMSMPTRITIRNTGTARSGAIASSALSGSNPAAFAIVGNDCRQKDMGLAVNESCTVTVQANPAGTAGQFTSDLLVVAASGASVNIPLQVNGTATSMVTGAPDNHDFGNTTNSGGMSAPRTFTFTNAGAAATSAPTVTLTGTDASSFMITGVNTCAGNPITAAGTCTVDVLFKPTTPGRQIQAQLTVAAGTTVTAVSMGGTVP
ncbi:MAG: choice-of-anchor D domain-containing protein [Deltaproteobacteria bacterium]|nr:choice-of-anchor D domain-containing protein [Deltaproteobacteria bacterium]